MEFISERAGIDGVYLAYNWDWGGIHRGLGLFGFGCMCWAAAYHFIDRPGHTQDEQNRRRQMKWKLRVWGAMRHGMA